MYLQIQQVFQPQRQQALISSSVSVARWLFPWHNLVAPGVLFQGV